jgi:hypothetical protein
MVVAPLLDTGNADGCEKIRLNSVQSVLPEHQARPPSVWSEPFIMAPSHERPSLLDNFRSSTDTVQQPPPMTCFNHSRILLVHMNLIRFYVC